MQKSTLFLNSPHKTSIRPEKINSKMVIQILGSFGAGGLILFSFFISERSNNKVSTVSFNP